MIKKKRIDFGPKFIPFTPHLFAFTWLFQSLLINIYAYGRDMDMSNFEIDMSLSIFELERRSKAQNVGNANGYLSGIFNFRYHFRQKSLN